MGGFARGVVMIEGFADYQGKTLQVNIQNENLIAKMITGEQTEVRFTRDCLGIINS